MKQFRAVRELINDFAFSHPELSAKETSSGSARTTSWMKNEIVLHTQLSTVTRTRSSSMAYIRFRGKKKLLWKQRRMRQNINRLHMDLSISEIKLVMEVDGYKIKPVMEVDDYKVFKGIRDNRLVADNWGTMASHQLPPAEIV
ncbi:unnamed protein product [Arabidopsis lyrata]|uniref:Predicted protein n=1 Tax=Arabidopsis lyrata subsp. lyrata TaxID=81972 RepID=D7MPW3_ARALL|nr:predicted protein [Arabidopsis lyrata subsp. lyrata]CAH8277976.1 unnamed protein product [Arabidopsis lyrata]